MLEVGEQGLGRTRAEKLAARRTAAITQAFGIRVPLSRRERKKALARARLFSAPPPLLSVARAITRRRVKRTPIQSRRMKMFLRRPSLAGMGGRTSAEKRADRATWLLLMTQDIKGNLDRALDNISFQRARPILPDPVEPTAEELDAIGQAIRDWVPGEEMELARLLGFEPDAPVTPDVEAAAETVKAPAPQSPQKAASSLALKESIAAVLPFALPVLFLLAK